MLMHTSERQLQAFKNAQRTRALRARTRARMDVCNVHDYVCARARVCVHVCTSVRVCTRALTWRMLRAKPTP